MTENETLIATALLASCTPEQIAKAQRYVARA